MIAAVAVSFVFAQSEISPTPPNTGSAPGLVRNVQVGPVAVTVPSLTVTYHSYSCPPSRPPHKEAVLLPDATPVFCAIWAKTPLAYCRPKKVTVNGLLSGSETVTLRVGEVPTPVAPSAGALTLGAFGAWLPAGGGMKPATQVGPLVKAPGKLPNELLIVVPEP